MPNVVETSWWLDWSALPERLLWARLRIFADGSADVLDLDGQYHQFDDRQQAVIWLNEDEYARLTNLVEDGEVGSDEAPPRADNDRSLVPLMSVLREGGA